MLSDPAAGPPATSSALTRRQPAASPDLAIEECVAATSEPAPRRLLVELDSLLHVLRLTRADFAASPAASRCTVFELGGLAAVDPLELLGGAPA